MKIYTQFQNGEYVLYIEVHDAEETEILAPFADPKNKLNAKLFTEPYTKTALLVIRREAD